jgi:hypothetical protein
MAGQRDIIGRDNKYKHDAQASVSSHKPVRKIQMPCLRLLHLFAGIILALLLAIGGAASPPKPLLLWPGGAPGAKGTEAKDRPTVFVYPAPADKANGTAVVVFPGKIMSCQRKTVSSFSRHSSGPRSQPNCTFSPAVVTGWDSPRAPLAPNCGLIYAGPGC